MPAVNVSGSNTINSVLETASEINSPVIIQFSNGGSQFIAGKGMSNEDFKASISGSVDGAYHIHKVIDNYNAKVIIHTDHCSRNILPWIDGLIDYGKNFYKKNGYPLFSSHMIDLSEESLEDNIGTCKEYLRKLTDLEMTLEIELGVTGGEEDGVDNTEIDSSKLYTQPEEVAYAYSELSSISENFMIAAAFGNVHGVYKPGNVKLTPKILKNSQEFVSNNFNLPHKYKGDIYFNYKDYKNAYLSYKECGEENYYQCLQSLLLDEDNKNLKKHFNDNLGIDHKTTSINQISASRLNIDYSNKFLKNPLEFIHKKDEIALLTDEYVNNLLDEIENVFDKKDYILNSESNSLNNCSQTLGNFFLLENNYINELKILLANETTAMLYGEKEAKKSGKLAKNTFKENSTGENLPVIRVSNDVLSKNIVELISFVYEAWAIL